MSEPQRILVIKLSSIGDVVHALPALVALRRRFPRAFIAWAVEEKAHQVVEGHPLLDKVILFDNARWRRALRRGPRLSDLREAWRFARMLRAHRFDTVVDLQGVFRSGVLAWITGAPDRLSFAGTREGNRFFMTRLVECDRARIHAIETYLALARAVGAEGTATETLFQVPPQARERAAALLQSQGVDEAEVLVAMSPSTSWPSKCWPPESFAALADRLWERHRVRCVILGGPGDVPLADRLAATMVAPPVIAAGRASLKETAALLERCRVFVGGDTGALQIAVALGRRTVSLFGPTDPARTGPVGEGHRVLQSPGCPKLGRCHQRACEALECMRAISVEEVLAAVQAQLGLADVPAAGQASEVSA